MNEHLTDEQLDKVLAKMRSVAQAAMGHPGLEVSETSWGWVVMGTSAAQLAHIEAFQPSTVLALLAEVERLREERDELQRRLDAVLAEHPEHVHVQGCEPAFGPCWMENACDGCGNDYPCSTVKAARGEA